MDRIHQSQLSKPLRAKTSLPQNNKQQQPTLRTQQQDHHRHRYHHHTTIYTDYRAATPVAMVGRTFSSQSISRVVLLPLLASFMLVRSCASFTLVAHRRTHPHLHPTACTCARRQAQQHHHHHHHHHHQQQQQTQGSNSIFSARPWRTTTKLASSLFTFTSNIVNNSNSGSSSNVFAPACQARTLLVTGSNHYRHKTTIFATDDDNDSGNEGAAEDKSRDEKNLSADAVYLDMEVANKPIGRLVFRLTNPSKLPLHAENFIKLARGDRRGIDPKAHYDGCTFDYSPATIEDGMGRYRWGHSCKGRGRNAIGRSDQPIQDKETQLKATHSCFGGQYYGDKYVDDDNADDSANDPGVFLTVPVLGPGYGSSKFSIVRVGESPAEWNERLLINCGVIGKLDPSSLETLHSMARQIMGPPTIKKAGVIE